MQQLLVKELAEHVGMNERSPWQDLDSSLTRQEVIAYDGPLPDLGGYTWGDVDDPAAVRREHIQRIQWLIRNPRSWHPVYLDQNRYGIPCLEDGHHRLFAAMLRNDLTIAFTWSGTWNALREAFPVSYRRGLFRLKYDNVLDHKHVRNQETLNPELSN